jgi:hypothetical protein
MITQYSNLKFLCQVLRDQGLGKYCDPEFVRAASREMQEAMDMTAEEFDAAAHQLLTAERQGTLRLPVGQETSGWVGEEESPDESAPLRVTDGRYGSQAEGESQPIAPSRKKKTTTTTNIAPNGR